MIDITRKQVRIIRSTMRQVLGLTTARRAPVVTFQAGNDALLIRAMQDNIAVEFRVPGSYQTACFAIPFEALVACEGTKEDAVRIAQAGDLVNLSWLDANIPQSAQFATAEPISMPELPGHLAPVDRSFLQAMADACGTTDDNSTRYALNCVRLRGSDGQIAATDGQQALIQSGYQFPWTEEVLVPGSGAFATKAIRDSSTVSIGRSPEWVSIRADAWTMMFKLEKDLRFPAIESQIPDVNAATTTMVLAEEDADFLVQAANRLPGSEEANAPVTLDLNGAVVVRAKASDQQAPTDLVLSNSQRRGEELKVGSNRSFVRRAISLGFREIHFRGVDEPAFCRAGNRSYIWALLGKDTVLMPDANAMRIESVRQRAPGPVGTQKPASPTLPNSSRSTVATKNRISVMESPSDRNVIPSGVNPRTDSRTLTNLIDEAEALRTPLRAVLTQVNALVTGLKRQRQQSKLMRSALQSLRAVQAIKVD